MYTNEIIHRIEDLKTETESHICGIQKCLVPAYIDLNATIGTPYAFNPTGNIAQYNIGDEICFVSGSVYFAIRVRNLPYIDEKIDKRSTRYFKDKLENLIKNGEIRPILIFYDNRFVPWSKISIVKNKDDSWLLLDDITDATKDVKCISFPFNLEYNESGFNKETAALIFNDDGEIDFDGNYVFNISSKNVIYRVGKVGKTILRCEIDVPEEYLYSPFNCFIFKDNILYPNAKVSFEGYNILTVDDGLTKSNSLTYVFFYNKYTSTTEDNPMMVEDRSIVKNAIYTSDDNINRLGKHLDFTFDPNSEYATNVKNALSSVMKHNRSLIEKIYEDNSRIETVKYTARQFRSLIKNGKVRFSTKRIINDDTQCRHNPTSPITYDENHLIEVRPMIFVNGLLSDMMRSMTIQNNICIFDTDGAFDEDDIIEVLFFKDINNEIIKSHTTIDENNYISYACSEDVLNKITADNLMAFCPVAPSNAVFGMTSIDENDRVQYSLPISTIEDEDNGKINLVIDSKYDYSGDRDITFVAANQFHQLGLTIYNEYQFNAMLTPEFNYCIDKSHYMVFINGRKIEQKHFKIVSADPRYPFDDVSIYLFFEMQKGDRLDIFYLPFICEEHIIRSNIPKDGNIYLDKYLFEYSLSKNLHLFFLNGKKVNQNDIIDIDPSRICINNDTETVSNLCILQYIPVEEVLAKLFKDESLRSVWEDVFGSIDQDTLRGLLGIKKDNTITNTEDDIYEWQLTAKEVIFEIARDYWLSERIYSGDVFVYNYDDLELTQEDFINEELAKIEDFTKKDPTGKKIANLQHGHVDFLRTKNGQPATKEDIDNWDKAHPKK